MKMKSLIIISLIFLLLLPCSVFAATGEGHVRVLDSEGEVRFDSIEDSENFSERSDDEEQTNTIEFTESNMDASEAMLFNVGKNLSFSFADQFLLSGMKINSLKIEEEKVKDDGSLKYSVFSKELDPFGVPSVNKFLGVTGGIYLVCMIIIGAFAYIAFTVQSNSPRWFSKLRIELTGEEGYFDINDVFTVWGAELVGPVTSFVFVFFVAYIRNILVSGMVTDIVATIASTSNSWPSYFIACVTWYFNGFNRLTAQFGIFLFVGLIFVQWIIVNLIAIGASVPKATGLVIFNHVYFVLLVFVDIETVFFIWFGTALSVQFGIEEFSIVGIVIALAVAVALIMSLPLYIASRIYFRRGTANNEVF